MRRLCIFIVVLASLFTPYAHADDVLLKAPYIFTEPHQSVVLQSFIDEKKKVYLGKINIVQPVNLRFTGVLKALPQKKPTGYLYTALQIMKVSPLPVIEYQAFLGAPASRDQPGDVIPVYIDNRLAEALARQDATKLIDQRYTWYGYHIYNFSRGPAIVLENVDLGAGGSNK